MKATILVVVLGLAGFLGWQKLFSPSARIERAYQTCLRDAATAGEKMQSDLAAKAPPGKAGDPGTAVSSAMAEAMTQGMSQVMQGMVQGLSGAVCGAMKNACLSDFDGGMCQGALGRYK